MSQWLITYIDALIPGVLGIFICFKAFFKPEHDSSSLDNAKRRQILRVCGVGLVVIGIFRFAMDSVVESPVSKQDVGNAVTVTTDDGMVSAESFRRFRSGRRR